MNNKKLDLILDACLERMFKGESVDSCLAEFPEYATELKPLLNIALITRQLAAVSPDPNFKSRAVAQFRNALAKAAMERTQQAKRRAGFNWHSGWVTALASAILLVTVSSGTVVAASSSMPGQPLYQVKLTTEQIRLNLTPTDMGKALVAAEQANRRVSEIVYAASKNDVNNVNLVTGHLEQNLHMVVEYAGGNGQTDVKNNTAMTVPISPSWPTPAPAVAPAAPVITTTAGAGSAVAPVITTTTSAGSAVARTPTVNISPSPVQRSNDQPSTTATDNTLKYSTTTETVKPVTTRTESSDKEKLQKTLEQNSVNHPAVMEEELKNAPESVKPALQKAIDTSIKGYEDALKAVHSSSEANSQSNKK
jgi:hypothetical protein